MVKLHTTLTQKHTIKGDGIRHNLIKHPTQ